MKKFPKEILLIVIPFLVSIIVYTIMYTCLNSDYAELQNQYDELQQEYDDLNYKLYGNCVPKEDSEYDNGISCIELMRFPDKYVGSRVHYTGTINQVLEDDEGYNLHVYTEEGYDFVAYVYHDDPAKFRFVEGDVVDIKGTSHGMLDYVTVEGATRSIPLLVVQYIELK